MDQGQQQQPGQLLPAMENVKSSIIALSLLINLPDYLLKHSHLLLRNHIVAQELHHQLPGGPAEKCIDKFVQQKTPGFILFLDSAVNMLWPRLSSFFNNLFSTTICIDFSVDMQITCRLCAFRWSFTKRGSTGQTPTTPAIFPVPIWSVPPAVCPGFYLSYSKPKKNFWRKSKKRFF